MNIKIFIFVISYIWRSYGSPENPTIVGGRTVEIEMFPSLVSVVIKISVGAHSCTGTILTETFVLTAGHCLIGIIEVIEVSVGSAIYRGGTRYYTNNYYKHPQFGIGGGFLPDYDVGLVEMDLKMKLDGTKSKPMPLATSGSKVPVLTQVEIVGWGSENENSHAITKNLKAVTVPVQDHATCVSLFKAHEVRITERMMCVGYIKHAGSGACYGDSGGPVIMNAGGGGGGVEVGVVSGSIGCASRGMLEIATNVATIRDWVDYVVHSNSIK